MGAGLSIRSKAAVALGRAARWGGETFMHRTAGNIPGAIALKVSPSVLCELAQGVNPVVVVTGTNGKTTTTNLAADCLETSGLPVVCNREGNNLESGIVTALMMGEGATGKGEPLACLECDELYTKYVLPRLRPRLFVLLNLFRDQLDRFGEIDRIQDTVAASLAKTPETVFVYNGDDPLCAAVAERVPNRSLAFGISCDLGLSTDRISDSRFCQRCGAGLAYDYVHYGQLGAYRCPKCGWERPELAFSAGNVQLEDDGFTFDMDGRRIRTGQTGVYMVYNVLAAYAVSKLSGLVAADDFQCCVLSYRPTNGRLQTFPVGGREVMTNLAKNPTGFNQNIRIVLNEHGRVLALFVNDNDADGHDVSWFWDIDFERWAAVEGLRAFVGGTRANDMQVRLKYAGIRAGVVGSVADVLAATDASEGKVYIIANYTALPAVRRELEGLSAGAGAQVAPIREGGAQ